jgi:hypothetical protein
MTDPIQPGVELLTAYVQGTLDDETSEGVRRWLYTGASDDELELYQVLIDERERARALLAKWAERPARAQLIRTIRNLERSARTALATISESARSAELSPLSGRSRNELVLELAPGVEIEMELRLGDACHFSVFVLQYDGRVHFLKSGVVDAAARINLGAMVLEVGDSEVEIVAIMDQHGPVEAIPGGADEAWLLGLLGSQAADRHVVHRTVRCAREPLA